MATASRLQRAATRQHPPGPGSQRRVRVVPAAHNVNSSSSSGKQLPAQIPAGSHSQYAQRNQGLPLAVNSQPQKRKRKFSWLCCGDYGRAAAIWGCLAVISPLSYFLLDWFRSQDETYAKRIYEEQRYQSDIEAKRLCVELKAAQLPWSHLGLDCDQIFQSPLPTRYHVVENTVAQAARTPSKVQAGMLAALKVAWGLQGTDALLTILSTCLLAGITVWVILPGRRSPATSYRKLECRSLSELGSESEGHRTATYSPRQNWQDMRVRLRLQRSFLPHKEPSSHAEGSTLCGDGRTATGELLVPSSHTQSTTDNDGDASEESTASETAMSLRLAHTSNRKATQNHLKRAEGAAVVTAVSVSKSARAAAAPKGSTTPSTTASASSSMRSGQSLLPYWTWGGLSPTRSVELTATKASALPSATPPSPISISTSSQPPSSLCRSSGGPGAGSSSQQDKPTRTMSSSWDAPSRTETAARAAAVPRTSTSPPGPDTCAAGEQQRYKHQKVWSTYVEAVYFLLD
ncbi:hypothetical protein N657DRAFT_330583 [Parathielavia appendiculata]|uniref:Uncharacterized protein n=1 Tax=Parathielavia appendiculata TaxID=2587402 RepID=A0AAN6U1T4_9PEZI|nr:hypothetical protein N657DRAFT_330583 [Parathielavia appendiculata]